jgi:hypothetical protein
VSAKRVGSDRVMANSARMSLNAAIEAPVLPYLSEHWIVA